MAGLIAHGLPDGLYAVVEPRWAAGFVVERGLVTMCAPILRADFDRWRRRARLVRPAATVRP